MNNNMDQELNNLQEDWSPDASKLEGMMQQAHERADGIRSFRKKSVAALALCLSIGLVYLTQSHTSLEPNQSGTQLEVAQVEPEIINNATQASNDNQFSSEERQSMLAIAEASMFVAEDFDFIEESLTNPWTDLLADF